ncbi:MAG: hypothetical protein E7256_06670 [Lachnospiraceae bacterium]|nr:hypothetical protein [Lachnospiraceae bacterium]
MDKIKLTANQKSYLRNKAIAGAKLYKNYLINKDFWIICEDGSDYKFQFKKKDFKHLTGIKSDLNDSRFFQNCTEALLSDNNIADIQHYNYQTLKAKADRISKINSIICESIEESLFMVNLHTNTDDYPVAIKNAITNTCIGFKGPDNYARTLRKASNSNNSDEEKKIVAIFSKMKESLEYNNIEYISDKDRIFELKCDIEEISAELWKDLNNQ